MYESQKYLNNSISSEEILEKLKSSKPLQKKFIKLLKK